MKIEGAGTLMVPGCGSDRSGRCAGSSFLMLDHIFQGLMVTHKLTYKSKPCYPILQDRVRNFSKQRQDLYTYLNIASVNPDATKIDRHDKAHSALPHIVD